jgi:hypothetical protein
VAGLARCPPGGQKEELESERAAHSERRAVRSPRSRPRRAHWLAGRLPAFLLARALGLTAAPSAARQVGSRERVRSFGVPW